MPRRRRKVGAGVERPAVGGEEDAHRPATLARQGLGGVHVNGVDIRAFLAVDLDRDEVLVDTEAVRGSSKDSWAITWHQWHAA